jgi:hypothetical protein
MFQIGIPTVIDFDAMSTNFIKANDAAMKAAAAAGVGPLRSITPVGKTGKMVSETGIKFFRQKNKLLGASLKVIGDRHFVSHILDIGTRDGRIKARNTFEHAANIAEARMFAVYEEVFFQTLEALNGK